VGDRANCGPEVVAECFIFKQPMLPAALIRPDRVAEVIGVFGVDKAEELLIRPDSD
jgi:hypothetical protein